MPPIFWLDDCIGFNNEQCRPPRRMASSGLSQKDIEILRALLHTKNIEELAKSVKMPPAALGVVIAKLQIRGYLGEDGRITEKGLNAVNDQPNLQD